MRMGLNRLALCLSRLPVGLETDVQRELTWLVYTELLELPFQDDKRDSLKDALLEELLIRPEMTAIYPASVQHLWEGEDRAEFKLNLEQTKRQATWRRIRSRCSRVVCCSTR